MRLIIYLKNMEKTEVIRMTAMDSVLRSSEDPEDKMLRKIMSSLQAVMHFPYLKPIGGFSFSSLHDSLRFHFYLLAYNYG